MRAYLILILMCQGAGAQVFFPGGGLPTQHQTPSSSDVLNVGLQALLNAITHKVQKRLPFITSLTVRVAHPSLLEAAAFLTLHHSPTHIFFSQLSARRTKEDSVINLGLGHRFLSENTGMVWGENAFLDLDPGDHHARWSFGAEAKNSSFSFGANYYHRITGWNHRSERVANGFDFRTQATFSPHIRLRLSYFKWFGHNITLLGRDKGEKGSDNPDGGSLGLDYQPYPFLRLSLERTMGLNNDQNNTEMSIGLTYRWTDPTVPVPMTDYVTRNNALILERQQNPTVHLNSSYTTDQKALTITPDVQGSGMTFMWTVPQETRPFVPGPTTTRSLTFVPHAHVQRNHPYPLFLTVTLPPPNQPLHLSTVVFVRTSLPFSLKGSLTVGGKDHVDLAPGHTVTLRLATKGPRPGLVVGVHWRGKKGLTITALGSQPLHEGGQKLYHVTPSGALGSVKLQAELHDTKEHVLTPPITLHVTPPHLEGRFASQSRQEIRSGESFTVIVVPPHALPHPVQLHWTVLRKDPSQGTWSSVPAFFRVTPDHPITGNTLFTFHTLPFGPTGSYKLYATLVGKGSLNVPVKGFLPLRILPTHL